MSEGTKTATTILDGEYVELQKVVRGFANEVVDPVSAEHDRNHTFPYEIVSQMGEMGLFGLPFPEEVGGTGGDYLLFGIALEELAKIDQSVAIALEAGVGLGAMPIFHFGNERQKETYLPELTAGKKPVGFGLTEPDAGSDAGATRTTAREDGDDFIINGARQFITNSGMDIASLMTVTAITGQKEDDRKEISTIIVPSGTEGFVAEPIYDKVGRNASGTHSPTSTDVRVSQESLLGTRGRGFANFLPTLAEDRVAIAALATGATQSCTDESVRHAKERHSMGRVVGEYQAVSFKIARMEARAHAVRMAQYDAVVKMATDTDFRREAYIAKMIASEAAMDNARDATRIFGGYRFMNEYRAARRYRNSRIPEIGKGTTEVQLVLIARGLGL